MGKVCIATLLTQLGRFVPLKKKKTFKVFARFLLILGSKGLWVRWTYITIQCEGMGYIQFYRPIRYAKWVYALTDLLRL